MLVNQEDLTGEIYQQNLPGTTAQYPNWARKMRFTLEQLDHDPEARMLTQRLKLDIQSNSRQKRGSYNPATLDTEHPWDRSVPAF